MSTHICFCFQIAEAAVTFCPEFAALTFLHPGSCSMFYNCSQISSRGPLRQYESECPYPQLFDADIWKCVPRSTDNGLADFCGQRSVPCNPCTSGWVGSCGDGGGGSGGNFFSLIYQETDAGHALYLPTTLHDAVSHGLTPCC